jgi:hypothetical protein
VTITQILVEVAPYKPMTPGTLYKHLRKLKIKPLSKVRECPQRYPADTPKRLLKQFGIKPKNGQRHGANLIAA